jgi:hypothetical protein
VPAHILHAPILSAPQPAPGSRTTALVATGVTLALVVATGVTYFRGTAKLDAVEMIKEPTLDQSTNAIHGTDRAMDLAYGLAVAAAVSGAVTGYLWSRTEPPPRHILIHPTADGAAIGYGGTF